MSEEQPRTGSKGTPAALALAAVLFVAGLGMMAFVFLRPAGPALSGLEPARARAGDTITLKGRGFSSAPQGNIVLFGDRAGRVISGSDSELRVEVPEVGVADGATASVAVRIVVDKAASGPMELAVFREAPAVAEVASVPPAEGEQATQPAAGGAAPPEPQPAAGSGKGAPPAPAKAAKPSRPAPVATEPAQAQAAQMPPGPPPVPPSQRRFVLDRTAVESNKRANADLVGFELDGVEVKRAPAVLGRVDFEVSPRQVKHGDPLTVKVYLINDGAKPIKLKEMFVATSVNGRLASGPVKPRMREIGSKKKEVIGTFEDTWRDTTATWAMDVTVTSERGDVYKNQVLWK